MKKQLQGASIFLLLLSLCSFLWLGFNSLTPVLPSACALPDDLSLRQYALSGAAWDEHLGGYRLTFIGSTAENLVLTVADMDEASVFFWGEEIAAWGIRDLYQRVRTVSLPAEAINNHGGVELLFRSASWGSGTKELLSRQIISVAKLMLGGTEIAEKVSALAFGAAMFSAGLHVLLIASSLALYRRKRSEKYLLFLACVAMVSLTATLLTANIAIIPVRISTFQILRPLISICPAVLHAAIGLSLFDQDVPPRLQRFLTVRTLLLTTLGLVALRLISSYSIYTAARWALIVPVVWTLSHACIRKEPEAWILLSGYALSEAVVVFLFLINNFQAAASGSLIVYLHMNQFSYLFVLLSAMFVINRRFADKFQESESLSQALSAMNAELDALVEERTRQLLEEQKKRNNMMTNIFHDLRSPLFILRGNLDQLHLPQEELSLKAVMENKLSFLTRLTEDLFLISKLEDGVVLYEENPTDLSQLLRALAQSNQGTAEPEGIELFFHCENALTVWADHQRLQQALQNLLDNAFRYTPRGGQVKLEALREGTEAVIRVTDTGTGISPEELPLIFERYFKSSRANHPRSSGLGLYIAKELIEHHRGTIGVQSQLGVGSCFTVRLPLLHKENK